LRRTRAKHALLQGLVKERLKRKLKNVNTF